MFHRQALEAVGAIIAGLFIVLAAYFLAYQRLPEPEPWPQGPIYFYNDSEFDLSLKAAVVNWNRVLKPLDRRFVETKRRRQADVIVRSALIPVAECGPRCSGIVSRIGAPKPEEGPDPKPTTLTVISPDNPETVVADQLRTTTLVHELGHVLGLEHDDAYCSVMNSFRQCSMLSAATGETFMCGPFESDRRQLGKLYGKEPGEAGFWCKSPKLPSSRPDPQ